MLSMKIFCYFGNTLLEGVLLDKELSNIVSTACPSFMLVFFFFQEIKLGSNMVSFSRLN